MRHRFIYLIILILVPSISLAYPDFISYGYTTCITCHTNSLGNGPLTQYGRALFSQEIAARPFIPKSVSDEELAEYSSFIPGVQFPSWFQPSMKYRGLSLTRNPGGSKEQSVWINMQTDISVVAATSNYKNLITYTYSILPEPVDYYNNGDKVSAVSKEHYLRFFATNQLLVSIGLMDKAYGIRTADHTAYNRGTIGMGKDDQADGVILQYLEKKWDVAVNYFVGNLMQKEELRQKGFSGITEFEIAERNRLGISFADFKTDLNAIQLFAIHDRWGLPDAKGSSLWLELGLRRLVNQQTDKEQFGNYAVGQLMINLTRGYNFITTFERIQDVNSLNEADRKKWSVGFLTFPFQRLEARVNLTQESTISPYIASEDMWYLQGQVHASF